MTDVPRYLGVLCGVLLASVVVWLWLVNTLYKHLAAYHPEKYRQMGEPDIRRNIPRRGRTLLKFIFAREDREVNDPQLSRLTFIMLLFFVCYSIVLIFSMIEILRMAARIRGS